MTAKDPLLQPFQLKHLTLKNRVLSTAHEPAYTKDRFPQERYRLYLEEKAKGGIGLNMFGGSCTVAPDSPAAFGNIDASTDAVIPHYQALAEAVKRHGAAIMNQITHLGRRTSWAQEHWLPIVSPSPVREMAHRMFPKAAEKEDIERIGDAYAEAARRSKEGGLDGVEIESAGHLMDAFWSPSSNKRDDEYGGSLDNRLRFAMEVLEKIRKRVGDDYIVGIRMAVDERSRIGFSSDEGLEIARRIIGSGLVDFLNVNIGHVDSDEGMSHAIPIMGTPSFPHLEVLKGLRSEVDIPILHASRIADVATARYAIESGAVDLVGMTRAHMTDPHIVAKIARGEEERIRPCVGAGYCIDQIYHIGAAYCLHNPATGREAKMPQVITPSDGPRRKVAVVGAGPAGLEAARVCGARGHQVILFEATDQPGGQVRTAAQVKRRRELLGITEWLAAECGMYGVDLRFNAYVEAADVLAEAPDIVIIATGGLPNTDFLDTGGDLVTSTWDVLNGHAAAGGEVLLYDENGRESGPTTAEFMAEAGAKVEFVTPDRLVAPDIGATNYPTIIREFYARGIGVTTDHHLTAVRREGNKLVAALYNDYTHEPLERIVDQVVVEYGTLPAEEIYFDLKDGSRNRGQTDIDALMANRPQPEPDGAGDYLLYRVGDAVASRNIHAAIYDSLRLCKEF